MLTPNVSSTGWKTGTASTRIAKPSRNVPSTMRIPRMMRMTVIRPSPAATMASVRNPVRPVKATNVLKTKAPNRMKNTVPQTVSVCIAASRTPAPVRLRRKSATRKASTAPMPAASIAEKTPV